MAKSSFYSGRGVTPENPDVTPVEPNNINAIEDSKNAAALSEAAAEASKDAAAQSATDAAASAYDANGSKILAEQAANFAGAFTSINQTHADNAAASATAAAASETAAAASETAAATSETNAAASEAGVATSATNAANSATAAATSATSASNDATAAATSATNAASSATAAAASATSASGSAADAYNSANTAGAFTAVTSTDASNAATSATNAASSATAASASETAAAASETAAAASETAAAASETAAATSETNAATSATNAASSATSASTSAATATTQASNAATSATNAATSETNAAASETAAAASETAAATSETNASNSATAAATSATQSANSAASVGNAETNSAASATQAATSATNAASSATNAATSESNAATSAANAATSASDASTSASDAATSASTAQGSATTATSQASAAAAQASNAASSATSATASQAAASASAGAASSSASAAAASASSAQASRDAALSALDNFDDRYLGQKTSDPSTDNDGDALVSGALYFNTTDDIMKVYDGSAWVAAYASLSGTLTAANNLSDLSNASDARTNLGLAIGTDVQAYDSVLAATTASYTTAQSAKLAAIEPNATQDQTITAGAGLDGGGTGDVTLSHSNTSSVQNTSNASNTFIQNLAFDTYGHVTSVSNGSMSIGSGTLSISGSGKIQGGGTFGANQSGNTTITLTHAASSASSVNNSGGTVIQDITLDSTGHIASIGSYNLDSRYYTETEADSRFANVTGDTFTGNVSIDAGTSGDAILTIRSDTDNNAEGDHPSIRFLQDGDAVGYRIGIGSSDTDTSVAESGNGLTITNTTSNSYSSFFWSPNNGTNAYKVFHDAYHPNADKWTTARTLSLTGAVTGSVSWDGSGNASLATTATSDPTLTLSGDASGSATFTNLGNATLSVTVADDSHNHVISNVDGLQSALDGKLSTSGKAADSNLLDGLDLHTGRNNNANKVVRTDGNGYLQTGWINTTSGATTSTISRIYASNDAYVRYVTPATFRSQITDGYYLGASSKAADSNLLDGIDSSSFLRSDTSDTFTSLSGTSVTLGSGVTLAESTDRADLLQITSNTSTWAGLQIRNSSNEGRWSFMTDGEYAGIYNDEDGQWHIYMAEGGGVDLRYGSSVKFNTTSSGANVTGNLTVSGTVDGRDVASDGTKLDGIASGATNTSAPNNATITLSAGTGLSGGGNFTTNQSSNETITFNLEAPYTYIDTATGNYGTIKVDDDRGVTWAGYAIRDDWVFMSNGAAEAGIYNDTDNEWGIKFFQNGNTVLYNNGSAKVTVGGTYLEMAQHLDMNNYDIYGCDQIFHHGDTDTYMQFHAADQWRVVTGGAERLEVNNTQITSTEPIHAPSFHGDGSQLTGIAAGAVGGVFYENDQNVTSNYTITNGKNAMSAGPITVNNGVTVTVGAGETWTVV